MSPSSAAPLPPPTRKNSLSKNPAGNLAPMRRSVTEWLDLAFALTFAALLSAYFVWSE
jgi:hypothetical protein